LWDFLTWTKGVSYVLAFGALVSFVPFWLFLTQRERD